MDDHLETPKSNKRTASEKEIRAAKKGKKPINYAEPESEEGIEDFEAPITPARTPVKTKGPEGSVVIFGDALTAEYVMNLPKFVLNCVKDANWTWGPKSKDGYRNLQFIADKMEVVFNLFGTIVDPSLGIYGDFNGRYHETVDGRYLMFNLASLEGHESTHQIIMDLISKIENNVTETFETISTGSQRACKKGLEMQFKRKICTSSNRGLAAAPIDLIGQNLWEKLKGQRVPNIFTYGAYDNQGLKRDLTKDFWFNFKTTKMFSRKVQLSSFLARCKQSFTKRSLSFTWCQSKCKSWVGAKKHVMWIPASNAV